LNILLVRLRLIGDVVFTTPIVRALRRRFPSAHLVYLVESAAAPVVEGNPCLSDVWTVPHRRGWRRVSDDAGLARRLHGAAFDLAIDLHGGPRSAWLTWASRAPLRVGYDVPGRSWMYTRLVHRPRGLHPRHSVENQWDLLSAVDPAFQPPTPEDNRVEMSVNPEAALRVGDRLAGFGIPEGATIVAIHVSAGNPFRRWPELAFAELAAQLVGRDERRWVLLTSGPSDHEAVGRILSLAREQSPLGGPRIVNGEGLSLAELRALCDRAALFIGGDSGPMHIASTSDVPIVGLYGPTLAARSAPWRPRRLATESIDGGSLPCRPCEQRVCVPGDYRCLTDIPARAVAAAAERLLGDLR
jgi:ADP-heptose:LPS heptosyltransferase